MAEEEPAATAMVEVVQLVQHVCHWIRCFYHGALVIMAFPPSGDCTVSFRGEAMHQVLESQIQGEMKAKLALMETWIGTTAFLASF